MHRTSTLAALNVSLVQQVAPRMRRRPKSGLGAFCDRAAMTHGVNDVDACCAIYVLAAAALSRIEQVIAADNAREVVHTIIDGAAVEEELFELVRLK